MITNCKLVVVRQSSSLDITLSITRAIEFIPIYKTASVLTVTCTLWRNGNEVGNLCPITLSSVLLLHYNTRLSKLSSPTTVTKDLPRFSDDGLTTPPTSERRLAVSTSQSHSSSQSTGITAPLCLVEAIIIGKN